MRGQRLPGQADGQGRPRSSICRSSRRTLPAGIKLTITISKPGYISKVTTIQIRKGKAPLRTDQCQQPGAKKLIRCPRR